MTEDTATMGNETTDPKDLREALDRANKRANAAEAEIKPLRLSQAGFAEGSTAHNALMKYYEGDISDAGAVQQFAASEFGFTPEAAAPGQQQEPSATPVDGMQTQQARADTIGLGGQSLSHSAPDQITELKKLAFDAEQKGDLMAAISYKNQAEQLRRDKAKG